MRSAKRRPDKAGRTICTIRLLRTFRFPGETTPVPQNYDRMIEAKFELVGTVDDIKREMSAMVENSGLEWFGWYFDQGVMSWDEQRRQLDFFRPVLEEFKDGATASLNAFQRWPNKTISFVLPGTLMPAAPMWGGLGALPRIRRLHW